MQKRQLYFLRPFVLYLLVAVGLTGCIGDDIIQDAVDEAVRISNPIDTLKLGDSFAFKAAYFNQIGQEESQSISWETSDPSIISIDQAGMAFGEKLGMAEITATASVSGNTFTDMITVMVGENTVVSSNERSGTIRTTSSYALKGSFILKPDNGGSILEFASDYNASSNLPGLYVYLTNNPNSTSGAFEIGKVTIFNGAHSYSLPASVDISSYSHLLYFCKPFGVKVGDGEIEN